LGGGPESRGRNAVGVSSAEKVKCSRLRTLRLARKSPEPWQTCTTKTGLAGPPRSAADEWPGSYDRKKDDARFFYRPQPDCHAQRDAKHGKLGLDQKTLGITGSKPKAMRESANFCAWCWPLPGSLSIRALASRPAERVRPAPTKKASGYRSW